MKKIALVIVIIAAFGLVLAGCEDSPIPSSSQLGEVENNPGHPCTNGFPCEDCDCPDKTICMEECSCKNECSTCGPNCICDVCTCTNGGDCLECGGGGADCNCGPNCVCDVCTCANDGDCLKCGGGGADCNCGPNCVCDVCTCANDGDCLKCGGGGANCNCGPSCVCDVCTCANDGDCLKCGGGGANCNCGPNCVCDVCSCANGGDCLPCTRCGPDCGCGANCTCPNTGDCLPCTKCGPNCGCGANCTCSAGGDCLPCTKCGQNCGCGANCTCPNSGNCTGNCNNGCQGTNCTCPTHENCPTGCEGNPCTECNPVVVNPPTGTFGFGVTRNTLIDTGLALKDGEVWVWGFRGSGQQGNGSNVVLPHEPPAKVHSLSNNIVTVTGSAYTLVALDKNGNAWGWGQNLYGAAGVGQSSGIISTPRRVNLPVTVDQIAAGEYFFIARGTDGNVYTWGENLYGQLGVRTTSNLPSANPVRVNLPNNETARLIGAAYEGAFVVTNQGNVYAWGDNESSGLGLAANVISPNAIYGVQQIHRTPQLINNLKQYANQITYIAGGNGWGQALLNNGTVIGWGLRASLGQGTTTVIGTNHHTNGDVITVTTNIAQMHSRYVGTIAITNDNKVLTWGQTGASAFPTIYGASVTERTSANGVIVDIGGGKEHVYYRTQDGRVWGAGYGAANKLLLTSILNRSWPGVQVGLE